MLSINFVSIGLLTLACVILFHSVMVVPQQTTVVVERLGRFRGVLSAGFHVLVPFVDVVRYRMSLKEEAIDIAEQQCITRDNVQVGVDGVLYLRVMNPERAAYGVSDFRFAVTQLAQTTLRSEMGKIDLDKTFEERTQINGSLVEELDKASEPWGVKVLRYEIKNIAPPRDVIAAMEKQMRAEREKRAVILTSEGERDAKVNEAEGRKRAAILASEGDRQAAINGADGDKERRIKESEASRQQQINEAEGAAKAMLALAESTSDALRRVAEASQVQGGEAAVQLRLAEAYIKQFGKLAQRSNTLIVPAQAADAVAMVRMAMAVGKSSPISSAEKQV